MNHKYLEYHVTAVFQHYFLESLIRMDSGTNPTLSLGLWSHVHVSVLHSHSKWKWKFTHWCSDCPFVCHSHAASSWGNLDFFYQEMHVMYHSFPLSRNSWMLYLFIEDFIIFPTPSICLLQSYWHFYQMCLRHMPDSNINIKVCACTCVFMWCLI